jgi:pimeloyl-ACP methyl ester carboxylesterase
MIEKGSGPALVLVPGLPGPWQFVRPAVDALAERFRALTLSLGPECTLDADVARIAAALDERRIDRAIVCGISFGGLVALRFAATHPQRTSVLVLASTPGPGATLRPHHRLYARWPRLCGPLFAIETPFRLGRELHWSQLKALVATPTSFTKIARRAQLIESTDIAADCRRVVAPTLVVTGEARLDAVVPVENTLEYLLAIPGAQHVTIEDTGHLGSITRPEAFRQAITDFVGRVGSVRLQADRDEVA